MEIYPPLTHPLLQLSLVHVPALLDFCSSRRTGTMFRSGNGDSGQPW